MDTYENKCLVPDCGLATVVDEYDPGADALRRQPELDLFCLQHFKSLMADRKARAAAEKSRCRRDGCDFEGFLYASGRWCDEHVPLQLPMGTGRMHIPPIGLLAAAAAGHRLSHLPKIYGRDIVDVELPEDSQPNSAEIEKNVSGISTLSEVTEIPGEPILYSTALADDDPRIPSNLRSALKSATQHGWRTKVTIACSSEELFSILVKFRHPTGKQLTTRHEQPLGKPMGFKVGWLQYAPTGAPNRVGWRDAMVFLKGTDPLDDRVALIDAMGVLFDVGGEVERVEVTA